MSFECNRLTIVDTGKQDGRSRIAISAFPIGHKRDRHLESHAGSPGAAFIRIRNPAPGCFILNIQAKGFICKIRAVGRRAQPGPGVNIHFLPQVVLFRLRALVKGKDFTCAEKDTIRMVLFQKWNKSRGQQY
jgi:hypothetical protein